jgi:hypothetical protein
MTRETVDSARSGQDIAYGITPEDALRGVLQKQIAFDPYDAEYIGHRPAFMDVETGEVDFHDWTQYQEKEGIEDAVLGSDAGPRVTISRPYNMIDGSEDRVRIRIENVWLEVNRGKGRAEVKFDFALDLREREWDGEDHPRSALESTWKCERKSTNPL